MKLCNERKKRKSEKENKWVINEEKKNRKKP